MCEARKLRARKTHTPRFTDFFTDFEKKKTTVLQSNKDNKTKGGEGGDMINYLQLVVQGLLCY